MLEASVDRGGGWSTVDAKAATETQLIEALGKAHGCSYKPVHSAEVTQKRLDRGWIKRIEVYDADGGFLKEIYLLRRPRRKPE